MPWQLTAQQLVAAFLELKSPPLSYPHGWARLADYDTFAAIRNLHSLLNPKLNDAAGRTDFIAALPNEPCIHPTIPKRWPHGYPSHGQGILYQTPAIATLAWQLANELNGVAFSNLDPDLLRVLTYVRDAADCD